MYKEFIHLNKYKRIYGYHCIIFCMKQIFMMHKKNETQIRMFVIISHVGRATDIFFTCQNFVSLDNRVIH